MDLFQTKISLSGKAHQARVRSSLHNLIVFPLGPGFFYPRDRDSSAVRTPLTLSAAPQESENGDPLHGLRPHRTLLPFPLHPGPQLLRFLPRSQG